MKTYIIVRRDLNMRRGKEIAQACHAVRGLGAVDSFAVVGLRANSLADLMTAASRATVNEWPLYIVRDAGLTEVEPGTATCMAVYAPEGSFDDFRLY